MKRQFRASEQDSLELSVDQYQRVDESLSGSRWMTQVKELRSAQQVAILQVLMPWIEQTERLATGSSTLSEVREARFAGGLKCPRCQFNDLTGTPVAYSKKQELWGEIARCMAEGKSVRKTAEALDVHVATAFAWRHKLLVAHRELEKSTLTGHRGD